MGFIGAFLMLLAVVSCLGLLAGTFAGMLTPPLTPQLTATETNSDKESGEKSAENSETDRHLVRAAQAEEEQERRENEFEEHNRLHALHEVSNETLAYDDSYMTSMAAFEPPWDVTPA